MGAVETTGISHRLREATWPQHQHAESRPLERDLARGKLPREIFVDWLGQRFRMHEALEREIALLMKSDARVAGLIGDELLQANNLRHDLAFFGVEADAVEATPASIRYANVVAQTGQINPVALLGSYYVFEGSKNGAKFIARAASQVYGLRPGPGMLYLDPHGDRQRPLWLQFKQDFDAAAFTDAEQAGMIEMAQLTFELVSAVDDELYQVEATVL